jgi:hypothetical protein
MESVMRTLAATAVVILAFAANSSRLCAGVMIGDQLKFGDGVGNPGGIFHVTDLTRPLDPQFDTFCIELTEEVDFTNVFTVGNISFTTVMGGKTLTPYTSWLYYRFRKGTLASFNPNNANDANALQLALWKSIGYTQADITSHVGPAWYLTYNNLLGTKPWQNDYNNDSVKAGVGSVRVINLLNFRHRNAQDQLILVPEPLTAVVWSVTIGCIGIVWAIKRAAARNSPAHNG